MKLINKPLQQVNSVPSRDNLKWSVWNEVIRVDDDNVVIFNTYTQAAILVNSDEYTSIIDLRCGIEEAWKNGFFVASDVDEYAHQNKKFIEGKKDLSYIDFTILLTHDCQMQCVYCFEGEKEHVVLNEKTSKAILEFLDYHRFGLKKLRVTWFGGEPLLAYSQLKDISRRLIDYCVANDIEYISDITTNGFALSEIRCHELVNELKVKRYIITLDGPEQIHNLRRPLRHGYPSFRIIWKNIALLLNEGAQVTIRMTIDRENVKYVTTFLDMMASSSYAGKVGLSFCRTIDYNFTPAQVKNSLFSEQEFADVEWKFIQYAHKLKLWSYRFPHAAPNGGCLRDGDIVIGANGDIYKCLDTIGNSQWISGHISDTNCSSYPKWYQKWLDWTPMESPSCKKCKLQPLCSGGCPHNALFNEKMHGTDQQCPDWKYNYKRQIVALVKEEYLKDEKV